MIPETLRLRNYLSHRETEVDFKGLHLAVLVGPNGAGKSSLLDALAWAVWGESRAGHAQEETLVHHGETFVEVELVFRLPYRNGEERRYRILRRRESKGRRSSQTMLDFQMEGERGWVSLNGNAARDTQKRIIRELHLDYQTFINSAYLRQGHADEFLTLDPADRKRILGTILGLERWEAYREAARDRLNEVKGQSEALEMRLAEQEKELAKRPQLQQDLQRARALQEEASARLKQVEEEVNALLRTQEQARALDKQLKEQEQRLRDAQAQLQLLTQQESQQRDRLAACQALIAEAPAIEAAYTDYQAALDEERAWSERLSQSARLQEATRQHERAIERARQALESRLREHEQQLRQEEKRLEQARAALEKKLGDLEGQARALASRLQALPSAQSLQEAEADLQALQALQERFEQAKQEHAALREEDARLRERNKQLKAIMEEKKAQLDLLAGQASCPLCRQPLTEEHRAELTAALTAEGKDLGAEYRANRERIKQIEEEVKQRLAFIEEADLQLRRRSAREQHVAQLRERLAQAERDQAEKARLEAEAAALRERIAAQDYGHEMREALQRWQTACAEVRATLAREDYAHEARAALAALADELRALGYDPTAHEATRARVRSLKAAETRLRELEKARVEVTAIEADLARIAQEKSQQQQGIAALNGEWERLKAERAALQPVLDAAPRLQKAFDDARQQEAGARQQVTRLTMELEALATIEKRLQEGRATLRALKARQIILSELRDAFSVQGIPALIIERTLPQLEEEANRLLERLSQTHMRVQFQTQKEMKSGNVRETLELLISDARGTRPYGLFSGGEQFRINFAVRVALSRLLAQRAGVRLRTLFIDEGFGALDVDGRDRLVEAIRAIEADFDLILVITHIEELQDAFPARIMVSKDGAGSHVEVV